MRCPVCASPVSYEPEDVDRAYGQALHLCRRYPACPGVVRVGPSDVAVYRREQRVSVPARVRRWDEQMERQG